MEKDPVQQLELGYLFFELPLYSEVRVSYEDVFKAAQALDYNQNKQRANNIGIGIKIDGYNPNLNEQTTYKISGKSGYDLDYSRLLYSGEMQIIMLECLRTGDQFYCILVSKANNGEFFVENSTIGEDDEDELKKEVSIIKIGQHPSLAEFHAKDYKKYRKILTEEKSRELVKAVRLSASGVGIGAFTYLRRIFEFLVSEAFESGCKDHSDWSAKEFDKLRMDDKIKFLENYLPTIVVENRLLYRILSTGVHNLSDQMCLEYFPVVRDAIELILDHKLRDVKEANRIKKIEQDIETLNRNLGKA